MTGLRQLRQIQLGRETTAGTQTTATTRWRGLGALDDNREIVMPEEFIGIIGGGDRSYIPKIEGALTMDNTDATFEQLPHLLIAGIANTTSGVQDSTGSGYVYTYNIPHSTAPSIGTYSIREGDNQQAQAMNYAFVQSFNLQGNAGEAVMMGANWIGRAVNDGTFSTSVNVPDVETILASRGQVYIDAVSDTYGDTLTSNTLLGFTANFNNLIQAKYTMEGVFFFSFHYAGNREITGTLRFEHNATAITERTAWRNQTPRLLRMDFLGSTLTTAGNYTTKHLIVDLPIKYTKFNSLDDQDGNSIVTADFTSKYNATAGDAGKFIVVLNETTSIP